jgi:LAO/AO transport system kinase
MQIVESVLEGNRLALARLLTQVENGTSEGQRALNRLFPHTGKAHLIGITGAPGTGKSSLVNALARHYRQGGGEEPPRVAIIAVDPSSPFTGGAILGDRVRMRDLAGDSGVFIRSMASRGSLGGLGRATAGLVQVLDAAGFDLILIETVGVGQAEVDIARLAHTTLVVEAPGLGDDIQAIKAGILEIADILVVNKADQPGVETTERALRSMLQLAHPSPQRFRHHAQVHLVEPPDGKDEAKDGALWIPPIVRTVATGSSGIPELAEAISRHYRHLQETGEWNRREGARLQAELDSLLQHALVSRWRSSVPEEHYRSIVHALVNRQISPGQAVEELIEKNGGG